MAGNVSHLPDKQYFEDHTYHYEKAPDGTTEDPVSYLTRKTRHPEISQLICKQGQDESC